VGDAVTIIVIESSQAINQAETQAGRSSDIGFGASGSMDGDPMIPSVDLGINSNNDFKGSGSTKSSGSVKTKISATIDSVYTNGNLKISGSRKITINGEEQLVKISGVVRSIDIQSDNSVYSYNISDAEIAFEGSGMIDRNQSPGWLTKLFHWLF
jgi:flagellar L-ring protein precursor FlgH